jgi:hypothetical protein
VTPLNRRSHGPSRSLLLKKTMSFFETSGWEIVPYKDSSVDFETKHRGFRCFVTCIDTKILSFLPLSDILGRLRHQSKELHKTMGVTLIAVWNLSVDGLSLEYAATSGALIFSDHELHVISSLVEFYESLPVNLTEREALLLQGNLDICISISERFKGQGDVQSSIQWLERAIRGSAGISIAYRKLCELYRELGDIDSIEKIARNVLKIKHNHIEYITILQKIATDRGDGELAAEWARQVVDVTEKSNDFESLIRRQRAKMEASGTLSQVSTARPIKKETKNFKLLSRILGYGKKA